MAALLLPVLTRQGRQEAREVPVQMVPGEGQLAVTGPPALSVVEEEVETLAAQAVWEELL